MFSQGFSLLGFCTSAFILKHFARKLKLGLSKEPNGPAFQWNGYLTPLGYLENPSINIYWDRTEEKLSSLFIIYLPSEARAKINKTQSEKENQWRSRAVCTHKEWEKAGLV